jgi:hypothetical protein
VICAEMADIKVTVEPPLENQIVEVTYDGQEIIQPPLTQAENLMRQVSNFILKNLKILTFLDSSKISLSFG